MKYSVYTLLLLNIPYLMHSVSLLSLSGEGLRDVSFRGPAPRRSFSPEPCLDQSWGLYNFLDGEASGSYTGSVRNPNKAVLTIESRTTKVGCINNKLMK